MMKKMTLGLLCVLLCGIASGQQTFTGKVTDANLGTPVPGATIEIENKGTFLTNEQGVFNINVAPGTYDVRVTSIGYKNLKQQADFTNGSTEFKLERFNLFLQPVEIRA